MNLKVELFWTADLDYKIKIVRRYVHLRRDGKFINEALQHQWFKSHINKYRIINMTILYGLKVQL